MLRGFGPQVERLGSFTAEGLKVEDVRFWN